LKEGPKYETFDVTEKKTEVDTQFEKEHYDKHLEDEDEV
jgi:hypothetical protein